MSRGMWRSACAKRSPNRHELIRRAWILDRRVVTVVRHSYNRGETCDSLTTNTASILPVRVGLLQCNSGCDQQLASSMLRARRRAKCAHRSFATWLRRSASPDPNGKPMIAERRPRLTNHRCNSCALRPSDTASARFEAPTPARPRQTANRTQIGRRPVAGPRAIGVVRPPAAPVGPMRLRWINPSEEVSRIVWTFAGCGPYARYIFPVAVAPSRRPKGVVRRLPARGSDRRRLPVAPP